MAGYDDVAVIALALRVPGEEAKAALLASEPEIYTATSHFDRSAAVLVRLERIPRACRPRGSAR